MRLFEKTNNVTKRRERLSSVFSHSYRACFSLGYVFFLVVLFTVYLSFVLFGFIHRSVQKSHTRDKLGISYFIVSFYHFLVLLSFERHYIYLMFDYEASVSFISSSFVDA